jgi:hypothetical protein
MGDVLARFVITFAPTLAVALGGLWLALRCNGFLCVVGWTIAGVVGVLAALQACALVSGFLGIHHGVAEAEQRLRAIEEQDAELFAQGMSFDEVMARRKQRRTGKQ